ncbi:MAG TPA: CocE/NonD family hydrolase [Gemmatimonadales bacterium]
MLGWTRRAVALLIAIGAASPAAAQDVAVERNVMIPARDGIRLATDIYRPARGGVAEPGRRPVLFLRTPYDKGNDALAAQATYFARNGYVVALQDARGRYRSGGTFTKYASDDSRDGYDSIEWLAAQPWSDGRVGMWGTSYAAHAQADAAKLNPPHLATMVLNQGGMADAWDHAVRHGGAFELGRELTWAWRQIPADATDPAVVALFEREKVTDWYTVTPLRKGLSPLAVAPNFESYFLEELTTADYTALWKGIGLNWKDWYARTADVPMLHIGGWYDIFLRGTVENYVNLSRLKRSPVRLLVGPWTHSANGRTYAGEVDFGPDAAIADFATAFHLRWFDRVFKQGAAGFTGDRPVRLFVMGTGDGRKDASGRLRHGGYWMDAEAWPVPGTVPTPFYFHGDGTLRRSAPLVTGASTTYTYDPARPVPTIGGNTSARLNDGAWDQRERPDFFGSRAPFLPLRSRADVVVFQTEPLGEDVTVVGPVEVKIWASSDAVDTDFTAKLVDVYPPSEDFPGGFDMNISDALIRASYRGGRTTRELMTPGQVYELTIRPFPTANVFKKGHRIRVDISSSNFPRFDLNPNTGEPLGQNRRAIPANNTIWHDAQHPSSVTLSILPRPAR